MGSNPWAASDKKSFRWVESMDFDFATARRLTRDLGVFGSESPTSTTTPSAAGAALPATSSAGSAGASRSTVSSVIFDQSECSVHWLRTLGGKSEKVSRGAGASMTWSLLALLFEPQLQWDPAKPAGNSTRGRCAVHGSAA
mmetsp:Transcript_104704/g.277498  ORF Transcript_104704/g.277498 Transcript_104704/m.277498 type:complete len:141 (-) Transcript_104704:14-436(-)